MSSLRNSLHRRNHKERSQLANRTRLGHLEKHKDYVLRARDYHSKQDRIQKLREKAAQRNKDEFYFAMNKEKTTSGVAIQPRGNISLPVDVVKVLKTQDENYIRSQRAIELKKIDQLKTKITTLVDLIGDTTSFQQLTTDLGERTLGVLQDAGILPGSRHKKRKNILRRSQHILFSMGVDSPSADGDDSRADHVPVTTPPSSLELSAAENSASVDLGWSDAMVEPAPKLRSSASRESSAQETKEHRLAILKELGARLERQRLLRYCERELQMQRLLMGKGARRKLQGKEQIEKDEIDEDEDDSRKSRKPLPQVHLDETAYRPRVYKWKRERRK